MQRCASGQDGGRPCHRAPAGSGARTEKLHRPLTSKQQPPSPGAGTAHRRPPPPRRPAPAHPRPPAQAWLLAAARGPAEGLASRPPPSSPPLPAHAQDTRGPHRCAIGEMRMRAHSGAPPLSLPPLRPSAVTSGCSLPPPRRPVSGRRSVPHPARLCHFLLTLALSLSPSPRTRMVTGGGGGGSSRDCQ